MNRCLGQTGILALMIPTLLIGISLVARGSHRASDDGRENPARWDQGVRIEAAVDLNPDPRIVEVDLTAAETCILIVPGDCTRAWAFNGQVPGPRIEANVGDTLRVHLQNELPVGTSIHWHGVEVPAEMDGSNTAQLAVPPGERFTYEFKVLNPATHWYHPHFRTNEQIDLGLAGPLIFRDPEEDLALEAAGIPRANELTIVLDDMLLDEDGQPVSFATQELELAPEERTLSPAEIAEQVINGREGDLILVNGQIMPTVLVRAGVPQRLRVINVANGKFMRLSLPDHTLYRIGGDGGLLEEAIAVPPVDMVKDPDQRGRRTSNPDPALGLLLTPSERADLVFTPAARQPVQEIHLEWHDFPRGRHSILTDAAGNVTGLGDSETDGKRQPQKIMRLLVVDDPKEFPELDLPSSLPRSIFSPLVDLRDLVDVEDTADALPVPFGHAAPAASGSITFFTAVQDREGLLNAVRAKTAEAIAANGSTAVGGMVAPPPFGPRPFPAVDSTVALGVRIGDVKFWDVINFTQGDHPFHAHGFFFQPIETLVVDLGDEEVGRPASVGTFVYPLENKDSIRLPGRPGAPGRSWTITRLAVRFDDSARSTVPPDHGSLERTIDQLVAFGKEPGGTGTGLPSLGDSGGWVFHCHINEHADQGMMSFYELRLS